MTEPVLISTNGSDRATAYAVSSKIVRVDNDLIIGWLDAPPQEGGLSRIMIGICDPKSGALRDAFEIGRAVDNHCGPALALDPSGRLHAIIGSHGQHHRDGNDMGAFRYRWSDTPADPESWSEPETMGPADTYPGMVSDAEGTLHLLHRECGLTFDERWELWYRRKRAGLAWEEPRRLLISPTRGYTNWHHGLSLGPAGELHAVVQFHYAESGHNYDCVTTAYAHLSSDDSGDTWSNDGKPMLKFPSEMDDTSLLRYHPEGRYQFTNTAIDADGRVYFLASDLPEGTPGLFWRLDPDGWTSRTLDPIPLGAGIEGGFTYGTLTLDQKGLLHAVMPAQPDGTHYRWYGKGIELYHLVLNREGDLISSTRLTHDAGEIANWCPGLEWWDWLRPDSCCAGGPWLLYTKGGNVGGIGGNNRNTLTTNVYLRQLTT